MFGHTNGINKEELFLPVCIGSDGLQLIGVDCPATSSAHLNIERLRVDIPHEEHHFKRFYVCPCCNERNSNGNTERAGVTELADEFLRISSRVGYRLHKVRSLAVKYLAGNLDYALGMKFGLCKDNSFRKRRKVGIASKVVLVHLGIDGLLVGFEDQPNVIGLDYITVKLRHAKVGRPACHHRGGLTRLTSIDIDALAISNINALGGGLRLDAVDGVIDIDSVRNRLLVCVVHNRVLVEELHRFRRWRCGKSYEPRSIKPFENRPPSSIDRTMTLVNDYGVEPVVRQLGKPPVNDYGRRFRLTVFRILVLITSRFHACQSGIYALDSRNGDAHLWIRLVALEPLRNENISKRRSVLCKTESRELVQGLFTEVVTVNKEKDALGRCV